MGEMKASPNADTTILFVKGEGERVDRTQSGLLIDRLDQWFSTLLIIKIIVNICKNV